MAALAGHQPPAPSPRRRRPASGPLRRRALPLLVSALLSTLLSACGGDPGPAVSERGQRLCQQQQSDLPVQTAPRQRRTAYRACLRTIDAELERQRQALIGAERELQSRTALAAAARSAGPDGPTRYLHCRQNRDAVNAAYGAFTAASARWGALAARQGADGGALRQAKADLERSRAELERLIPVPMRAGQPLLPGALGQFRRCDPASFR